MKSWKFWPDDKKAWKVAQYMQTLKKSLLRCLSEHSHDEAQFMRELNKIRSKEGDKIFSVLLKLLTDLDFEKEDAQENWLKILDHQEEMTRRQGRSINLLTAICDYFFTVNKFFNSPKVIELDVFEKTIESSKTDPLTGLYNRRYFDEALAKEINRGERYGAEFSLLFLDIDDFKVVNDTMGHKVGDIALQGIANLILATKRSEDTAVRYGGEEFVLILPETNKMKALVIAERIRERAEQMKLCFDKKRFRVTLSGGLASFPADGVGASQLLQNADKAMYVAKSQGKNNIALYSPNKRQFFRVDFLGEILTKPLDVAQSDAVMHAKSKNLSLGGVLFESKVPISLGTYLQVQIPLPSVENPTSFSCVVTRVESFNASYEIGVSFLNLKKETKGEVIDYLLKHLQ